MTSTQCPLCESSGTVFQEQVQKWLCSECLHEFVPKGEGDALPETKGGKRIFFSYGHDGNQELVDRFKTELEARGHRVWKDCERIGPWDDWKAKITEGIHESQMAIAFLSIHSTRDPGVCRNEIAMALQHFGTVYPIMVEAVPQESVPVSLTHLQWPDFSQWRAIRDGLVAGVEFEDWYAIKFSEILKHIEGDAGAVAGQNVILRRALDPCTFDGKFEQYVEGFTGREWVFDEFEEWIKQGPHSRVFWLKSGPGFGKTALAVQLATRYRKSICGSWFCDAHSGDFNSPVRAVRTLAFQLAQRWHDYRIRLLNALGLFEGSGQISLEEALGRLDERSADDLFVSLIAEPLAGMIPRDEEKWVILVDALDEAAKDDGTNPLAALLSRRFLSLPDRICFAITSRDRMAGTECFSEFKPLVLTEDDPRNIRDLQSYIEQAIWPLPAFSALSDDERQSATSRLLELSSGSMLALRALESDLRVKKISVQNLATVNAGSVLRARYQREFENRFGHDYAATVRPVFEVILAAKGPIKADALALMLNREPSALAETLLRIGPYLVNNRGAYTPFHKTLSEWLRGDDSGRFQVNLIAGSRKIATLLWSWFSKWKTKRRNLSSPVFNERFVLNWLPDWLPLLPQWRSSSALAAFAELLADRKHFDDAEILLRRALELARVQVGETDEKTLLQMNRLGNLLRTRRKFDESESLLKRVLEIRETVLGADHKDTLNSVHFVAELFRSRGDLEKADVFFRRAVDGRCRVIGTEAPSTLRSMQARCHVLQRMGLIEDAATGFRKVLEIRERTMGLDHPDTVASKTALGNLLRSTGRNAEAVSLLRASLEYRITALGENNPQTNETAGWLALTLSKLGGFREAELLFRTVYEWRMTEYGPLHPKTLAGVNNFAVALWKAGNPDGASGLLLKHESDHPGSASMLLYALARIACLEGKFAEGEQFLLRHLAGHPKRAALALANPDFAMVHGCIRPADDATDASE